MGHGTFQWGLVDHALVGLKLSELSEEMRKSIQAEENQIRFDNRHNQNNQAVPALLVQMHERRTDDCAEKTYKLYCEVWEKQGYTKTAEFVRAVSAHAIPVMIAAHKNAVVSQLSMERARTGAHIESHNARMVSFEQSMQRLAARWAKKLEIEARECEHAESARRRNKQPEDALAPEIYQTLEGLNPEMKAVDLSDAIAKSPVAAARRVASGVAQVSLADLNIPVGSSLKEAKRALLKLGAPARKLKDPRILEAADYKIAHPKCTYKDVSIRFFDTPKRADSIRSWVNKRKSSDDKQ